MTSSSDLNNSALPTADIRVLRSRSALETQLPNSRSSSFIYATAADDVITATTSKSTVYAGDGNNVVFTGKYNDVINTGSGRDIIDAGNGQNIINGGEGINLITSGFGDDVIFAGASGDFISAGNGSNTIFAGDGNNRILSGKGRDLIYAGAGNDTISSGAGNDTIYAGDGNNVINAGIGNDTVTIGSGKDKLILEGGLGSVTVIGFDVKSDKLRLGESLLGKSLKFVSKGSDTLVMSGKDLLATLKNVATGSPTLLDNGPLYRYQATDLGSLSTNPNESVNAASINDFGQIAGRLDTGATFTNTNATTGMVNTNNLVRQGFIWENGIQTALTSTGVKNGESDFGAANGATVTLLTPNVNTISDRGVILGTGDEVRQPNPKATDRALLWEKKNGSYSLTINDFGAVESYFFDTNHSNQIVGRNILASDVDIPLFIENGVVTRLDTLGGEGGTARGINNKGQIVGVLDSDGLVNETSKNTAALWQKNANGVYQLTNLGTFGAEQASLRDINNAGQIIGATSNGSGATTTSTPFLLRDDEFTALGSLGGQTGSANGINEFGEVVGASQIASGSNHGYVWNGGIMADLNSLITTPLTYNGSAVTLNNAASINNFGDIVATGTYTYVDANGANQTGTRSYVLKIA